MAATPEELELLNNPTPNGKTKGGSAKLSSQAQQTTEGLATKLGNVNNSAIKAADQDTRLYAQAYLNRFSQNMGFINGQLAEVWTMPGKIAVEQTGPITDQPPISEELRGLFQ